MNMILIGIYVQNAGLPFILRILERKLKGQYRCEEVIHTLLHMDLHKVNGFGYLSSYTRTDITDALHEPSSFRTDTEFISDKSMKKILKQTKSKTLPRFSRILEGLQPNVSNRLQAFDPLGVSNSGLYSFKS